VQLRRLRQDLRIEPLRGNLDTRLRKLDEGQYDAIVVALAGLKRMGWQDRATQVFSVEEMVPAIGQGALTMTPLQVAYSVGGIASGGNFARPRLLLHKQAGNPNHVSLPVERVQVPLSDATVAIVTDAMYGVVNEGGGTGVRAKVVGLDIGGKTGSAQVASNAVARAARGSEEDLRDNAWFVAVAPRRNPEIAVAVLYQSGEHGYLAAPLARDVIKAYFDKQTRSAVKNPMETAFFRRP